MCAVVSACVQEISHTGPLIFWMNKLANLDSFHRTHHQNGLHHPGTKPTQQAPGAVQAAGLVLCAVAEIFKHSKPEEGESDPAEDVKKI